MTVAQQKKILQRMATLEADIEEMKRVRMEIAKTGVASASMSSGSYSKSYTNMDLSKVTEIISSLTSELNKLRAMLNT